MKYISDMLENLFNKFLNVHIYIYNYNIYIYMCVCVCIIISNNLMLGY